MAFPLSIRRRPEYRADGRTLRSQNEWGLFDVYNVTKCGEWLFEVHATVALKLNPNLCKLIDIFRGRFKTALSSQIHFFFDLVYC